jgi:hypothetical protein
MLTKPEKELLIQIMANIDDIKKTLTPEQKKYCEKCFQKINGNYHNLLEGVEDDK